MKKCIQTFFSLIGPMGARWVSLHAETLEKRDLFSSSPYNLCVAIYAPLRLFCCKTRKVMKFSITEVEGTGDLLQYLLDILLLSYWCSDILGLKLNSFFLRPASQGGYNLFQVYILLRRARIETAEQRRGRFAYGRFLLEGCYCLLWIQIKLFCI